VLIEGETGVGKDIIANTLHKFSNRSEKPFIKINCGSIPENLIESELFGYETGAFTGASREGKKGLVEIADGGTLFLDEIGELPLNMQVKLLDFIQDGSYKRIGGTDLLRVDARIVAATNRNLHEMCENGQFRKDLFYRLNVMPITIPPLRDRTDDIYMFVKTFLSRCNSKYNEHKAFSEQAYKALASYSWPGNVRELEYFVERAYIMAEGHIITDEAVDLIINATYGMEKSESGIVCMGLIPLKEARHELERLLVSRALRIYKTTYKAAEALGVDQSTIVKLSKRLNTLEQ
jgi:transcriptional regulator with PAS, ATPase and Fis domain